MTGFRALIKEMAVKLDKDEQVGGLVCPSCQGGERGDKSFSLRRDVTRTYYKCHRASCGIQGSVNMAGIVSEAPPKKKHISTDFTDKLEAIPNSVKQLLLDRYGLKDLDTFGLRWAPLWDKGKGRVAIPLWDRWRNRSGWAFRSLEKDVKPKSIIMMSSSENPCLTWYLCKKERSNHAYDLNKPILVVEDPFSAMRASYFVHAVALLGTNMSDVKIADIKKAKPSECVIALDEDATQKAALLCQKLSGIFDSVSMRHLKKDLKDCTDEEIQEVLKL